MRPSPRDRARASGRARRWLRDAAIPTDRAAALRQLGLWLCDRIRQGAGGPADTASAAKAQLPPLVAFLGLERAALLALARSLALLDAAACARSAAWRWRWSRIFGAVALSYARVGDAEVAGALVRAAARLRLCGPWLDEAEAYLLDQQRPDGGFGLLLTELAQVEDESEKAEALLRLTVDALWALTETASRRRPRWARQP